MNCSPFRGKENAAMLWRDLGNGRGQDADVLAIGLRCDLESLLIREKDSISADLGSPGYKGLPLLQPFGFGLLGEKLSGLLMKGMEVEVLVDDVADGLVTEAVVSASLHMERTRFRFTPFYSDFLSSGVRTVRLRTWLGWLAVEPVSQ